MNLIDWSSMNNSVSSSNHLNWLQQHGYTQIPHKIAGGESIQLFASQTGLFAVYAPLSFVLLYYNISSLDDALGLISTIKRLLWSANP